jgi:hypothetical protein
LSPDVAVFSVARMDAVENRGTERRRRCDATFFDLPVAVMSMYNLGLLLKGRGELNAVETCSGEQSMPATPRR